MTRRHDNHTWIQADAQGEQTKSTNTLGNSAEWGRDHWSIFGLFSHEAGAIKTNLLSDL